MAYVNFLKLVTGIITQHDDSLSTTDDVRVRHMDVTGDLTVSGSEIIVGGTTFRGNVAIGDSSDDLVTITSSGTTLTADGDLTLGGLTADKLVYSTGGLLDNTDLSSWVADFGSANISVVDDGSGGITLDTAQDIASGDSPTFAGLTVTNAITEFSTDGTLAGDSDSALPTEKAVKLYVDTVTSTLSGSMDHGGLLGLGDDDHTQYILVDGTRAFTGNVQANASGTLDIGSTGTPFGALYADDVYVKGTSVHIGNVVELTEYNFTEFSVNTDIRLTKADPIIYSTAGSNDFVFKVAANQNFSFQNSAASEIMSLNNAGAVSHYGSVSFIGAEWGINSASANDMYFRIGDSIGTNRIYIEDWGSEEIVSFYSDGLTEFYGNVDAQSNVTVSGYVGFNNSVQLSEAGGDLQINSDIDLTGTDPTIFAAGATSDLIFKVNGTGKGNQYFEFRNDANELLLSIEADTIATGGGRIEAYAETLRFNHANDSGIIVEGSSNLFLQLGTDDGTSYVNFEDDNGAVVAWVDSNGNASFTSISGAIISDSSVDHGGLSGLGDDDHTQYILHSLADAANDFLVASGDDTFVRKTLAETGAILEADLDHGNIQGLGDDDHTQYILVDGTRAFTGNVQANASGTLDIGSSGTPFAGGYFDDIYVKGTSIHLGDAVELTEVSSDLNVNTDIRMSGAGPTIEATSANATLTLKAGAAKATRYIRFNNSSNATMFEVDTGTFDVLPRGDIDFENVGGDASILSDTSSNIQMHMGDNAGTNTISFRDSDGTEVAWIDSNGNASFQGDVNISGSVSGTQDHGALIGLSDDDHTQYHTDGRALTWLGTRSISDIGTIDHDLLDGLADDDHTQYHTDARALTWLGTRSISDIGTIDHDLLDGLADDDHTQYSLVDGTRAFSSTVGGVTPVADADLATKGYVDSVAVAPDALTVASGVNTAVGSVLYVSGNDTVNLADKDDSSATKVVGLATAIVNGDGSETANVQADGILTGALVGATAGTRYYLGDDGALSSSPPSETGDYVLLIGIAANTTDIYVRIGDAILL